MKMHRQALRLQQHVTGALSVLLDAKLVFATARRAAELHARSAVTPGDAAAAGPVLCLLFSIQSERFRQQEAVMLIADRCHSGLSYAQLGHILI